MGCASSNNAAGGEGGGGGAKRSAKATFNGEVVAETDAYEAVDGNAYFPMDSLKNKSEYFKENSHTTVCGWKGTASYFDVTVNGKTKTNGAWFYPSPKQGAINIKNHVAFYGGGDMKIEKF